MRKTHISIFFLWYLPQIDKQARGEVTLTGLCGWWKPVWPLCNGALDSALQQLLTIRIRKHRSRREISSGTAQGPPTWFC